MSTKQKPWALVTGAAKRIGHSIALDLAKAGWNIIVHYHKSQAEAAKLIEMIQDLGAQACLAEIDLEQGKPLAKLVPALAADLKPLSLLINNASLFEKDDTDLTGHRHWAINFEAPRILSEAFDKLETDDVVKTIINILDADPSKSEFKSYNKSKIALRDLTLEHALRFAPKTCVHGIELGPILPSPRESSEHFQEMVSQSPLKCRASLEDIARAVRFLSQTPSMTGNILSLDGGLHLIDAKHENGNRQLTKLSN